MVGRHFSLFLLRRSSTFCSCFLLLLPSTQCQTPRVFRQHRGDGEHDDQGFASRHGTLQAPRQHCQHRLCYRWGKRRLFCICWFEGWRASAVHVSGPKLQKTIMLPCFRVDQSCSHVSTCFCFWKVLFQQQHRDSRYYRMSQHLFVVLV